MAKLTDEQILKIIAEFEALNDLDKSKRLVGQGVDKLVYDIPGQDMVMKIPNHTREYGNTSLENDYIYSKQLNRHIPVETPILVKRPNSTDVLLQKKLNMINDPESPTDEFFESLTGTYDDKKSAIRAERKRLDSLPGNIAYNDYLKKFDNAGLEDGDIHRGNVALDNTGKAKAMDVSKFWFGDHAPEGIDVRAKNDALQKMRDAFSDNMDKLTKTRIFRGIAGALPLAGTAVALSSGNANAAIEELPSELPIVGQAYDAIKPETAGSEDDDKQMIAERNASVNYKQSPAHQARLSALKKLGQ